MYSLLLIVIDNLLFKRHAKSMYSAVHTHQIARRSRLTARSREETGATIGRERVYSPLLYCKP